MEQPFWHIYVIMAAKIIFKLDLSLTVRVSAHCFGVTSPYLCDTFPKFGDLFSHRVEMSLGRISAYIGQPRWGQIFSAISCHASQTWCDWNLCSWSVFPIINAVEYEVLRNFWDTSIVSITYINITYIDDCTVTYIHALHVGLHPWARVVFHVQLHQVMRYLPKTWLEFIRTFVSHSHRWTFTITHCILEHFGKVQISLNAFVQPRVWLPEPRFR